MNYSESDIRATFYAYFGRQSEMDEFVDLLDKVSKLPEGSKYVRSNTIDESIVGAHLTFTQYVPPTTGPSGPQGGDVEFSGVVTGTLSTREGLIVALDGKPVLLSDWSYVLVKR